MMKIYDTRSAAEELGVEPRALRRFLRAHPSYQNAGMGGRYQFVESDLAGLRHDLKHQKQAVKAPKRIVDDRYLDDDPGMSPEVLDLVASHPFFRMKFRRYRADARRARLERLNQRMTEVLPPRYDDEPIQLDQ